ncbi:MAG: hypothetical protein AAF636_02080 [Pseudomonadota bacterium]
MIELKKMSSTTLPAVMKTAAQMMKTMKSDAFSRRASDEVAGFGLTLILFFLLVGCFLFICCASEFACKRAVATISGNLPEVRLLHAYRTAQPMIVLLERPSVGRASDDFRKPLAAWTRRAMRRQPSALQGPAGKVAASVE